MNSARKLKKKELDRHYKIIGDLSNQARYRETYQYIVKLLRDYPNEVVLQYLEAVFYSEQSVGRSQKENDRRYRVTAKKLHKLLKKRKGLTPRQIYSFKNEYYWFSKQPYKQYRLGVTHVGKIPRGCYYSQGVGASQLALKYMEQRKIKKAIKWAVKSEKAWLKFFKADAKWYNSYLFYARALGLQGRLEEMESALKKGAKVAKKSHRDPVFNSIRKEVREALAKVSRGGRLGSGGRGRKRGR